MKEALDTTNTNNPLLALLILIAIVTAIIPNIGQQLYELGVKFQIIDVLNVGSYLIFAVVLIRAWRLLEGSKAKWLLLALIPVAYFQPLLWAFAQLSWSNGGFAP